jgi:hypothetical protein
VQLAHVAAVHDGRRQVLPVHKAPPGPLAQKILPALTQHTACQHCHPGGLTIPTSNMHSMPEGLESPCRVWLARSSNELPRSRSSK